MKRLFYICFILPLLMLGACTPEVDDAFDKSASQRIEEAIAQNLSVLTEPANGWVMEYYPSPTLAYGGYTILVQFGKDGKVKTACDLFVTDLVAVSEYEVKQSMGVMLTFDTYNNIFHFFSEPANRLGIGERGYGMEGDYEFIIQECTPEKVVLKGRKTGNKMVMHPVPANKTWDEYLTSVKNIPQLAYPAAYDVLIGGVPQYSVMQKYHKFILVNDDGSQQALPFIYTTEGISFYEPLSIGTQNIKSMAWNKETMAYENGNISIKAQNLPTGYHKYQDFIGSYTFIYGNGETLKDVTLREELYNESFIMEGFPMDIRIVYKAESGMIGLESQKLDDNIYLSAWNLSGEGSLTATEGTGMIGSMLESGGNTIIYLQDNGVWEKKVDSFVVYDFSGKGSIFQMPFVIGMVKK